MLRKNPAGHFPEVSDEAFIDDTAIICGKVIIEANVFVGPYAVIRADEIDENGELAPIIIKRDTNIQDGVVIHCKGGTPVVIGERASIAHRTIVHGPCEVGDEAFIGFNSVVFRSHVGNNCVIEHNSVVDGIDLPAKTRVPALTHVNSQTDVSELPKVDGVYADFSNSVVEANHYLVKGYKDLAK